MRLRKCERGAVSTEFGMVMVPTLLLLMGSIELSYFGYVKSVISGSIREVARSTATGQYTQSELDTIVRGRLSTVGVKPADVIISTSAYQTFDSTVSKPEPLTQDSEPFGQPNVGDCYYDLNKNGLWNSDTSGGPEDILHYSVSAKHKLLFGITDSIMGAENGAVTIKATTTIKNEPYNNNSPELCIDNAGQIGS